MISIFDLAALLLSLSAFFGWINRRFIGMPHSIGMLVMGLLASLSLILADMVLPEVRFFDQLENTLRSIDFTDLVMNGMLAFLLFAGALTVDLTAMRNRAWSVAILALIGTTLSTLIVGFGFWALAGALNFPMPLIWAMVFGALISPTDPVAVMSTLKTVKVPSALEAETLGESLFNDGVGVVIFTLLLGIASGSSGEHSFGITQALEHLLIEAGGGLLLGAVTGYAAYRAMRTIDDFPVEVLISLALVMGTYAIAHKIGVSGPLSMVSAGLLIGYRAPKDAMSERTESYVFSLWTLIDEVLNSVLFLLIGLEVLLLATGQISLALSLLAIPLVLAARMIAVSTPLVIFGWRNRLRIRNVPFLTWAGVRGGISVALALALPDVPAKPAILAATYSVVLFSIIIQGATLGTVARATLGDKSGKSGA
jgi:CPA1 family monovalent cation:H+ antiporter